MLAAPFVIPGRHLPARATVLPPALHGINSRRSSLCGRMRERGFVGTFGAGGARLGLHAYAQRTAENLPCALHSQNISLNCDARGAQARGRVAGSCWMERTQRTAQAKSAHADSKPVKRSLQSRHSSFIAALACQVAPRRPVDCAHPFDSDSPLPDTPHPVQHCCLQPRMGHPGVDIEQRGRTGERALVRGRPIGLARKASEGKNVKLARSPGSKPPGALSALGTAHQLATHGAPLRAGGRAGGEL